MPGRPIDISGQRFGRLIAVKLIECAHSNGAVWLWKCDCGKEKIAKAICVRSGNTRSCGCLQVEHQKTPNAGWFRKLDAGEAAFNALYHRYQKGARKRDLPWNLTKDEFRALITSHCKYCDQSPSQCYSQSDINGSLYYNGVDRVNNDAGYECDNCVACCNACNRAKSTMTLNEFLIWVTKVYKNMQRRT